MNILHITATHLQKGGGIPNVLVNLTEEQNKIEGVSSIVLSVKHNVDEIDSHWFIFKKKLSDIKEYINSYNPDIVIFHGVFFLDYVLISFFLQSKGFNYYIEPHASFNYTVKNKNKLKKEFAFRFIFKRFIKMAYGYIFLNNVEMKKSLYKTQNDLIIPNGINKKEINTSPKTIDDKIVLYFMGRIDFHHKGLDILFDELKKIDNTERPFKMKIYGTGSEDEINQLKSLISDLENIEVEFLGPVYGEEKMKVLLESNIMILTSRIEGFPVTVLEALANGNPCIVTKGTNVMEMIETNNLGWGTDYDNISETIIKAVTEYQNNMKNYSISTREFVFTNYLWENIAIQSIDLLEKNL